MIKILIPGILLLFTGVLPLSSAEITIRCFNSQTENQVVPSRLILIHGRSGDTTAYESAYFQGNPIRIDIQAGYYLVEIYAEGYDPLFSWMTISGQHNPVYEFFLDPLNGDPYLSGNYIYHRIKPGYTFINGYIHDVDGHPLPGAMVFSSASPALKTHSNQMGYYELYLPVPQTDQPEFTTILCGKNGYSAKVYENVIIWSAGDWQLNIRLTPGNDTLSIPGTDYREQNTQLPAPQSIDIDNLRLKSNKETVIQSLYRQSNCIPSSIRVGLSSSGGSCCWGSCGMVQVYSINTYVKHVVPHEWLVSWNSLPNMIEGYKAAAVAVKSYAIYYVNHPGASTYDICSSACCQVFGSSTNATTNTAVDLVDGWVLKDGTQVARAEYSSENNNKSGYHCSVGWVTANGCGDGYFGRSNTGSPCYADPPGTGYIQFGHGRGMSQFGSARWASGIGLGSWCQGNPYGGSPHGYGTKSWSQILNHYYSYFLLENCGNTCNAPVNDYCGNAIALNVSPSCSYTQGDICGATQSLPAITCAGYTSTLVQDVWYSFVATSSTAVITVAPSPGMDAVVDLRSSACSGSSIACSDDGGGEGATEVINASGLVPGNTYYIRVYDYTGINNPPSTTTFNICVQGALPCSGFSASATPVPVSCYGGSDGAINLQVNGGSSPYTYQWSNGSQSSQVTGISAGSYQVTVTDANGCTTAISATVTQPAPLNLTLVNLENVSCWGSPDGSIEVTASGGTPPYAYQWSNGITGPANTGLYAGSYTVTVNDAHGCQHSLSLQITSPPQLSVALTVNDATCNGSADGMVNAAVSGGTPPYTYTWSDGSTSNPLNGVGAGNYSLTVSDDHGCSLVRTVTIREPAPLLVGVQTSTHHGGWSVSCHDASDGWIHTLPAGGTPPYTFLWSTGNTATGLTQLPSGQYTLTITDDHGCTLDTIIRLTAPLPLQVDIAVQDISCYGYQDGQISTSVNGGTAPYRWSWSTGDTLANLTGLADGSYQLTVIDMNQCQTDTVIPVQTPLKPFELSGKSVSCYQGADGRAEIVIPDTSHHYRYRWSNGDTSRVISGLPAGIYMITVHSNDSQCVMIDSITIGQPDSIEISLEITPVSCPGMHDGSLEISITGGIQPYQILWSTGATTPRIDSLPSGFYGVVLRDSNQCIAGVQQIEIVEAGAFILMTDIDSIRCYGDSSGIITLNPVPADGNYYFLWSTGDTTAAITGLNPGTYTVTVVNEYQCQRVEHYTLTAPGPLNINPVIVHNPCDDSQSGSIGLNPSGGKPPYQFLWSTGDTLPSLSGLAAGTYSITLYDHNGCQAVDTLTVNAPPPLSVQMHKTDITCAGLADGMAISTVTGGTPPYNYLWTTGDTSAILETGAGLYFLVVTDANGCIQTGHVRIDEPDSLSIVFQSVAPTTPYHADGQLTVVVTGGTPPYTYQWNTGDTTSSLTGLNPGLYKVTITDSLGCVRMDSIRLDALSLVCEPVTGVYSSRITPTSARLHWSPHAHAIAYMIRGRRLGANNWTKLRIPANRTFIDVHGLSYGITYQWQIKAYCMPQDSLPSVWSLSDTFTTGCYPPDSLWTYPVASTAARFNWKKRHGAAGYEIKGRKIGGSWQSIWVGSGNTTYRDFFNLQPATAYEWKIRAICGNNGYPVSAFSPVTSFTTLANARLQNNSTLNYIALLQNPVKDKLTLSLAYHRGIRFNDIRIINMTGQQFAVPMVGFSEGSQMTFDVSHLPAGVYYLLIENTAIAPVAFFKQ